MHSTLDTPLGASAQGLVDTLRDHATESGTPPQALARELYGELRSLARCHRARWNGNETLNTTAVVHEAYLKLAAGDGYGGRSQFLSVASRAMRQVFVSYARQRDALKRGGAGRDVCLDDAPEAALCSHDAATDVLGLDQALGRLAGFDARAAQVVELKVFGDLTLDEVAGELDVSAATVTRDWRRARAWLRAELGELPTLQGPS